MKAALFCAFIFPPPPASPELLAQADGTGARCTTDAGIKLIVQGVVVHLVEFYVVPDIAPGPIDQWIDFGPAFGLEF